DEASAQSRMCGRDVRTPPTAHHSCRGGWSTPRGIARLQWSADASSAQSRCADEASALHLLLAVHVEGLEQAEGHRAIAVESSLHPLEDGVVLAVHAEAGVDLLRAGVAAIDVEANAADRGVVLHHRLDVAIEAGVDPHPAHLGNHVHALDPPDESIAPVAPFISDHQRASDAP